MRTCLHYTINTGFGRGGHTTQTADLMPFFAPADGGTVGLAKEGRFENEEMGGGKGSVGFQAVRAVFGRGLVCGNCITNY